MKPLTRVELDLMLAGGCGNPECTDPRCKSDLNEVYIQAQCHPEAPMVAASYVKGGQMRFECAVCRKLVVEVEVAKN